MGCISIGSELLIAILFSLFIWLNLKERSAIWWRRVSPVGHLPVAIGRNIDNLFGLLLVAMAKSVRAAGSVQGWQETLTPA